jgi:hypothetical protein
MSGPKRNPDKLNTIGVIVVGICGAVLVYVSITALQAFYMNDTSSIQSKADYEGMDVTAKGKKADELRNISEAASNGGNGTYRMRIEDAMKLVVESAKTDPSHLTGDKLPPSTKESIPPMFGRPKLGGGDAAAPAGAGSAAPAGAGSAAPAGAGSAAPAGAGSAAPAGAGSAAAAPVPGATGSSVIMTPTGAGPGPAAGASPAATNTNAGAGSGQPARPRTP